MLAFSAGQKSTRSSTSHAIMALQKWLQTTLSSIITSPSRRTPLSNVTNQIQLINFPEFLCLAVLIFALLLHTVYHVMFNSSIFNAPFLRPFDPSFFPILSFSAVRFFPVFFWNGIFDLPVLCPIIHPISTFLFQIYFRSTFPADRVGRRDSAPTLFCLFWRRL